MATVFPIKSDGYPGKITFVALQEGAVEGSAQTGSSSVPVASGDGVTLYLPQALQITDAVEFSNTDLGIAGGAVAKASGSGGDVSSNVNSILEGLTREGEGQKLKDLFTSAVGQKFGTDALAISARAQTNPNTRALFKSVPLREFTFTFKMIPTSSQESTNITDIIKYFRTELYPEDIGAGEAGGGLSLGYKFPNRFKITQTYNGKPVATPIQPCYLKNFAASYNSGSMAMHEDGGFSEVDITMTFMESKALTKQDIINGTA